jgi:polar amino acid transport system substrate-binding protein
MRTIHLRLVAAATVAATGLLSLAGASAAQSPAPSMGAVPTLSPECADPAALPLKTAGTITIETDNPAYDPWWLGSPPPDDEWTRGYPPSGEGFEAATAVAVAGALGFTPDQITWVANNGDWTLAFQPGDKAFDFHLAQLAITPERQEAVDFSDPYFESVQAVVALADNPIVGTTTIEGLKGFRLGAAQGSTSFGLIESVIQPTVDVSVFNSNDDMVIALNNAQIDGGVADLNSAIYMRTAQLNNGTIVGQFSPDAQVDRMGMVLQKDSPLTACVNQALAIVKATGQLQQIFDQYIGGGETVPVFE